VVGTLVSPFAALAQIAANGRVTTDTLAQAAVPTLGLPVLIVGAIALVGLPRS
jgi:hypothetical protein